MGPVQERVDPQGLGKRESNAALWGAGETGGRRDLIYIQECQFRRLRSISGQVSMETRFPLFKKVKGECMCVCVCVCVCVFSFVLPLDSILPQHGHPGTHIKYRHVSPLGSPATQKVILAGHIPQTIIYSPPPCGTCPFSLPLCTHR